MFRIGEFTKLSHVTVKTLRYYDRIGLLRPAEVDRFTNYRYYSASQLPRLNRILALKGLGLSLDQIGRLLENDLPPEQIRGMLRLKQIEIRERLDQEQARLALVEQRLEQIEQEEAMPREEVAIKDIPSQTVASVRDTIPSMEHIDQLFGEIFAYLGQQKLNRRWLRRSSRMTSTGGGWNRPSSFTTSPPGVRRMSRV
jgi:DNA-binding transcriptional MerR regulator